MDQGAQGGSGARVKQWLWFGNRSFGVLRLPCLPGSLESLQGELQERGGMWSCCLGSESLYTCYAGEAEIGSSVSRYEPLWSELEQVALHVESRAGTAASADLQCPGEIISLHL